MIPLSTRPLWWETGGGWIDFSLQQMRRGDSIKETAAGWQSRPHRTATRGMVCHQKEFGGWNAGCGEVWNSVEGDRGAFTLGQPPTHPRPCMAPTFDGGAHLGREGREHRADRGRLFDKVHHRVVGRQARGPERGG